MHQAENHVIGFRCFSRNAEKTVKNGAINESVIKIPPGDGK